MVFYYYIDYNIKKLRTERISKITDICSRLYINFFLFSFLVIPRLIIFQANYILKVRKTKPAFLFLYRLFQLVSNTIMPSSPIIRIHPNDAKRKKNGIFSTYKNQPIASLFDFFFFFDLIAHSLCIYMV